MNIEVGSISFIYPQINKKVIYIGILVGSNDGQIMNCNFTSSNDETNHSSMVIYENSYIGAIAGLNNGSIIGCQANVNFTNWGNKGSICGYNSGSGKIEYCMTSGTIEFKSPDPESSNQYATGGIVAINYGSVKGCYNYASISYTGDSTESRVLQPIIGQIIGINYGEQNYNFCYGYVDKGNLKTVTWTTGSLWWQETHTFNQAEFVSVGTIGQDR